MLNKIPDEDEMITLLGTSLYGVWKELCKTINEKYTMEQLWNSGGRNWTYEYKYRRGQKTLCTLYARSGCIGFMAIFGKLEREKFEENRKLFSKNVQQIYDDAKIYHDGKWVMYTPTDDSMFEEFIKILELKRKLC